MDKLVVDQFLFLLAQTTPTGEVFFYFYLHLQWFITQLSLTCLWCSAGITEGFSMCGGDFVEVYSDPSQIGRKNSMASFFLIFVYLLYLMH